MSFANKSNISVIFPGQGSQYVGMGKVLYDKYPIAKKFFDLADDTLGVYLSKLCFEGDIAELTKTYNAQPALLTVSYIMYQVYVKASGLKPISLLGHSLGEITALVCTNAIDFKDALKLVKNRGLYMQDCADKNKGSMLAVFFDDFKLINELCNAISNEEMVLDIANYNSNNQIVVAGDIKALNTLRDSLKQKNIKSMFLNVSAPFHSSIMKPAADKFYTELNKYNYRSIDVPVISNLTGDIYPSQNSISQILSKQMVSPVRWLQSVKKACNLETDLFLEVGPKCVLKNLNKNICPNIKTLSLDLEKDVNCFQDILGIKND